MSLTLFEIEASIRELVDDAVDPETGEINEDALANLEALELKREDKLLGYAAVWKELDAERVGIEYALSGLRARILRAVRRMEFLEAVLEEALPHRKGVVLKDSRSQISYTRSERTEPGVVLKLPRKLLRFPPVPPAAPDKAAIKAALQGKLALTDDEREMLAASGAEIVERFTLKIE